MRSLRATVLSGVLAAGLMLTQQACTIVGRRSADPVAFTVPTTPGTSAGPGRTADPLLAGGRQIAIRPVPSTGSIVAVDEGGRLGLTDGKAQHGLFVVTPVGDRYLIRTAGADASGEPSCLGIRDGGGPSSVEAAVCDPGRAGQLFTITARDEAYAISNQGAFLQVLPGGGLIAGGPGDAPVQTTYAFVDNGPATLPALD